MEKPLEYNSLKKIHLTLASIHRHHTIYVDEENKNLSAKAETSYRLIKHTQGTAHSLMKLTADAIINRSPRCPGKIHNLELGFEFPKVTL